MFELERIYKNQWYLEILFKTMFAISYYGLMRIGEVTASPHILKAKNVHIATNKDKLLLVLYSSKTHDEGCRPQKIKITANAAERTGNYLFRNFCPFKLMRLFIKERGCSYETESELFFVFRDKSAVNPQLARKVLKNAINTLGLDSNLYDFHCFHIGRSTDLMNTDTQ